MAHSSHVSIKHKRSLQQRRSESVNEYENADDFEEGRHLKVAVSHKGLSVTSLVNEDRRKRDLFERDLARVINANFNPITNKQQRATHLEKWNRLKNLGQTTESSHQDVASFLEQTRKLAREDTYTAFRTCKLPVLVTTPVCVVQPTLLTSPKDDPNKLGVGLDGTAKVSFRMSSNSSRGHGQASQVPFRSPRREPYHASPWTFDERKCFFTTRIIPPHQRRETPITLERNVVEVDSGKMLSTVFTPILKSKSQMSKSMM
ncbi:uncharacterized protein LOC131931046 [Physella acuta]|uniref:uncharacterized protein LOC131931046 n=1 Tax=Physella acuta TaxID=109671 RepID=UPI0027DBDFAC|nr:uncharacterized protein LOC131931046 [Physella acuta]